MGFPVSTAKLTIVNTMPMRVPCLRRSVVRLLSPAGNRLCSAPATTPTKRKSLRNVHVHEDAATPARMGFFEPVSLSRCASGLERIAE